MGYQEEKEAGLVKIEKEDDGIKRIELKKQHVSSVELQIKIDNLQVKIDNLELQKKDVLVLESIK